ncbi:hypothetical protein [Streptomyces justiciae]|uniref:hypothetical protein n=1 Tax=Streptomyces justiciae TaxID=2780140 RepID=UPI0009A36C1B|nr:hypothetical protein [Streptomyces justiciae]MCW8379617.1 hypothetical protein [Streptomyces justiciae]OPG10154.1 hypothetical protein B1R27_04070 [Streptomyces sp. GKU 895]
MTTAPDEDQYLRQILTLLEGAKSYEALTQSNSKGWEVQPGSALAGDDAKTDPYQVSHNVWNALSVSVDHLHCYRSSLVGEQQGTDLPLTLHTHAQYSLLRGAFENSARAVWLLAPANRLVRVQRRLSLQAGEYRHSDHMLELLKQQPRRPSEERKQQLTDLVVAAGTDPGDAKKALRSPDYKDIVREAGVQSAMGADQAEIVWSSCSSLAHGDVYGTLSILERNVIDTQGRVNLAQITSSPQVLWWATDRAVAMMQRGFDLFKERATCHR